MQRFLVTFFVLFIAPVTVYAQLTTRDEISAISARTNLRSYPIIDTTLDWYGEDAWSFGGVGMNMDLITRSDVRYSSNENYLRTKWLLRQVLLGRIADLGFYSPYYTHRPSQSAAQAMRLSSGPSDITKMQLQDGDNANWIILTDLEPDDRMALMLLAQNLPRKNVLAVGANLLHSGRKAELARRLLRQIGWDDVPVLQGNGGEASSYPEFASNAAAKTYQNEGNGILTALEKVDVRASKGTSIDLQLFIVKAMQQAYAQDKKLNILVLSPATDFANAVLSSTNYSERNLQAVNRVVMVGGWVEVQNANGAKELRSTYNWNMDPISARVALDKMPNMTIISSHLIKPVFGGGSLNASNAPGLIEAMTKSRHSAMRDFHTAGGSWDHHLIEKIPPLANVIGPYAGNQFTPADVLAAAYVIDPSIVTSVQANTRITLDVDNADAKGALVKLEAPKVGFPTQSIVQGVDKEKFLRLLESSMKNLDSSSCELRLRKRLGR